MCEHPKEYRQAVWNGQEIFLACVLCGATARPAEFLEQAAAAKVGGGVT